MVVAYENQVVMDETLDGALTQMFGGAAGPPTRPVEETAGTAPAATTASGQFQSLLVEARSTTRTPWTPRGMATGPVTARRSRRSARSWIEWEPDTDRKTG